MNQSTYNSLKSFIWNIANDCLVDVYDVGDYRKIILPMFVIRRFDAVLEPTHDAVVAARKKFEATGKATDFDPALMSIAGQIDVRDEIIPEYDHTEDIEPNDEIESEDDSEEESEDEE